MTQPQRPSSFTASAKQFICPECHHALVLHEVDDERQVAACCVEGCTCGHIVPAEPTVECRVRQDVRAELTRLLARNRREALSEERLYDLVTAQLEEEFDAAGYDGETATLAALERIKASVNVWLAQRSAASSVSAKPATEEKRGVTLPPTIDGLPLDVKWTDAASSVSAGAGQVPADTIAKARAYYEAADWYRRCLEGIQDRKVVRGLAEAKAAFIAADFAFRDALAAVDAQETKT